jgi:hypothetical protein
VTVDEPRRNSYRTLRVAASDMGVLDVVMDAPPMNLIGPESCVGLVRLLDEVESDEAAHAVEAAFRIESGRNPAPADIEPSSDRDRSADWARRDGQRPACGLQFWLQLAAFAPVRPCPQSFKRARQLAYGTIANGTGNAMYLGVHQRTGCARLRVK